LKLIDGETARALTIIETQNPSALSRKASVDEVLYYFFLYY
jgi:hypothetical protein